MDFAFRTKAQNLVQLFGHLDTAQICPILVATVDEWQSNSETCLHRILDRFGGRRVIVRSSAPDEDGAENSMAGAFESVADVDSNDLPRVRAAISQVVDSYRAKSKCDLRHYEILVQPMVEDVRVSGVVFTRDLEKNAPYYLLNYDDQTSHTDSVTGGSSDSHKVLRVFKGVDAALLEPTVLKVLRTAHELETITGSDAIDIEFAIDGDGRTYVLQVRPLARTRILSFGAMDRRVSNEVDSMRQFVRGKLARHPHVFGALGILGEMPDWNPAEIIGTHPKPLAHSLYRFLIMKSTWREARCLVGYRDPFPQQLMVLVGGRPYVDVRASFNSFVPAKLSDALAEKLVEYYLARLRAHPEFHDKIEFEIVVSCLCFDFGVQARCLCDNGFTESEVDELRMALRELTEDIISDRNGVLAELEVRVGQLKERRERILASHRSAHDLPMVVEQLLEDCVTYGTLPFSVFARCGFIGNSFLRSLVSCGAISREDHDRYLQGIDTVTGSFVIDLDAYKRGSIPLADFLERYGHLRPGTYDICTHTYADMPDLYLSSGQSSSPVTASPASASIAHRPSDGHNGCIGFPEASRHAVAHLLEEFGFGFSFVDLEAFIRRSMQLREYVKFEFTKNLSAALDLVAAYGSYHGLGREDLSCLEIRDLMALANTNLSEDHVRQLRSIIQRNKHRVEVCAAINLPDLIFSERDVEIASLQTRRPNFVGQKKVVAPALTLGEVVGGLDLAGKIVLVENADPGYDWLFSKGISGLVTKYGGAASHMAIRCAEFGLPAAIGCGERIFDSLATAKNVKIDSVARRVEPYGFVNAD